MMREVIDRVRDKAKGISVAILLALPDEGKVTLVAGLSKELLDRKFSAVDWLRKISPVVGGKGGGGRPDMAQAGGKDASKIQEAFLEAKKFFE